MKPNAVRLHNPDPARLRALMAQAGIPMSTAAAKVGVSLRTLERYLSPNAQTKGDFIPYPLQFTLEALCETSYARKVRRESQSLSPRD